LAAGATEKREKKNKKKKEKRKRERKEREREREGRRGGEGGNQAPCPSASDQCGRHLHQRRTRSPSPEEPKAAPIVFRPETAPPLELIPNGEVAIQTQ